jgi:GxxExxY protein
LPVHYKGVDLDCGYRLDLVVEGLVVLELKSVSELLPIHSAQVLTYLKLSGKPIGLLINFNVPILKKGLKRLVNHYAEPAPNLSSQSLSPSPRLRVSAVNKQP